MTFSPGANRQSDSSSTFSIALAFLIPFILGSYWAVYWLKQSLAILLLRPSVVGFSFLAATVWYGRQPTMAERRLAVVLGSLSAILLIPSLAASNASLALQDWVKVTILYAACLVWTRLLRDQATGKAVASSLIICSCLLCALIVVVYVTHLGWVLPTYKATRGLKGLTEEDIPLNAVPFAAILAYFTAMCLLRTTKRLLFLGVLVLAISTLFTGSRTPLAIVGASAFILGLILAIRSNKLLYKVGGWICLVVCTILLIIAIHNTPIKEINKLSEGRIDLWSVAWDKFLERPIFGNGFDSWDDDLVSRLPGEYRMASLVAKNLAGGGYHNEYLTMLAEQGIVGTIPALYFFGFFFATCWKLSFRQSATWHHGNWALFGCLVILLRASVEIPGLFGYGGQEPADYLCFLFVALAVSRLSIEEDYLRAEALAVPPPEPPSVTGRLTGFRASDKGIAHLS